MGAVGLTPAAPDAGCPSALRLDRLLAGELDAAAARATEGHAAACARCRGRLAAHREDRDRFRAAPPPLPVVGDGGDVGDVVPLRARPAGPARRARTWAVAAVVVAAAAALVLWVRQRPAAAPRGEGDPAPGVRAKGGGDRLGVFVKRGEAVARGASGDEVAPGDALRFTVTTAAPRHVVVAGRDGAGAVQVYFPDGPRAEPLPAGEDVPLAFGVELDGVLGRETFYGVFCDAPIEVERVRAHLFAGAAAPPGCAVDSLALEKRAPAGGP